MNPSEFTTSDKPSPSPPRKELQLQGPRPTPLKVRKDSYKIKKPPLPPQASQPLPPLPPPQPQPQQPRQPVIIYTVSPKVIHTTASDFMNLVQRLTGPDSSSSSSTYVDDSGSTVVVSPAARFATIEKANNSNSPSEKEKLRKGSHEVMDVVELEGLDINGGATVGRSMGLFPGILSPLPSSLPPISPSFFSPAFPDPNPLGFLQDLSPMFQNRNFIEGTQVPSPSTFLSSVPLSSPSTPYMDLFNHHFDF